MSSEVLTQNDLRSIFNYLYPNTYHTSHEVGEIIQYAGTDVPTGFLRCDGQEVLKSEYEDLYDVIGDTYGTPTDPDYFVLPNFKNRFPVGTGDLYSLNSLGGSKDAIIPYHNHGFTQPKIPNHTHSAYYRNDNTRGGSSDRIGHSGANNGTLGTVVPSSGGGGACTGGAVGYAGTSGNTTNANLPPYIGINYYICYKGGQGAGGGSADVERITEEDIDYILES